MENDILLDRYIQYLQTGGKKEGTVKQYTSDLKQFTSWLDVASTKGENLLNVSTDHIASYTDHLKEKNLSKTTVKRHISAIKQLLNYYQVEHAIPTGLTEAYRAPSLKQTDFISNKDMHQLLKSMKQSNGSAARDVLIHRNLAIIHLIRYNGFRPKEVSSITMNMINMGQSTIALNPYTPQPIYQLSTEHMQHIRDYLQTIDHTKRPRRQTSNPLFVAFNNRSHDYQYDYELSEPKRLSVRGIQKMIKEEVQLAGVRPVSAKHLRNSCILDHILQGRDEDDIQSYFHLTHPFSLYRYAFYADLKERP